jgi:hypothetical protein
VNGDYRLDRSPMSLQGRPQWVMTRDEASTPAESGR